MPGYCQSCGKVFERGERIFQLAKGTYYAPAITPTLSGDDAVLGEWHQRCLGDLVKRLHPQIQPYRCCFCREEVEDRTLLVYGVIGDRPDIGYLRPERRGYELQIVSCYGCWYSRKRGWSRSQSPFLRLLNAVRAEARG